MIRCNLCGSSELSPIYRAKDTKRNLTIHVCLNCSLVQSLPRIAKAPSTPSLSAGANFGDIRYGKRFRAQKNLDMIRQRYPKKRFQEVLDVGAGRGDFARAFLNWQGDVCYIAVEPDASLMSDWDSLSNVTFVNKRIEQVVFSRKYDLIYCSHTLEHLEDPKGTLKHLRQALSKNGIALFEVPNLSVIERDDFIEEFFIDKHLYHFSSPTFYVMLTSCGFYPPQGVMTSDMENITTIVECGHEINVPHLPSAVEWAQDTIEKYSNTLATNYALLRETVVKINWLKSVVVWGGGRIYHKMLEVGLNPKIPVIDTYLKDYLRPEAIQKIKPEWVIIASRAYRKEIGKQVTELYPEAKVRGWDELLEKDIDS